MGKTFIFGILFLCHTIQSFRLQSDNFSLMLAISCAQCGHLIEMTNDAVFSWFVISGLILDLSYVISIFFFLQTSNSISFTLNSKQHRTTQRKKKTNKFTHLKWHNVNLLGKYTKYRDTKTHTKHVYMNK